MAVDEESQVSRQSRSLPILSYGFDMSRWVDIKWMIQVFKLT